MKVLIFGAGAVGQAAGGLLAEAGCDVTLLLRPAPADAVARDGLTVNGLFGDHRIAARRLTLWTDLPHHPSPRAASGSSRALPASQTPSSSNAFDFVLVTVKSYDTAAAAEAIGRIDDGRFTVVSLQNGYGNVERLTERFGGDRVLGGRVITGFVSEAPGRVRITVHADSVTIGRFDGQASEAAEHLAAVLTAAGLPARASTNVQAELWAKILYNCALNPLGAILGVTYGRLAEQADTRATMDRIVAEAYAVMAARGLPRLFDTADAFRSAFYGHMVPPTADHTPSMLQDLRAGKRTEIDALNGAIVRLAGEAGLDAPANQAVTAMVRFLEGQGGRKRARGEAS